MHYGKMLGELTFAQEKKIPILNSLLDVSFLSLDIILNCNFPSRNRSTRKIKANCIVSVPMEAKSRKI